MPPNPNELTEPRRGWSDPRIQGRLRSLRKNGDCSISRFGLGRSTLMVGGSTLWWSAITTLNRPAAPAAALVWPTWDLTVPMAHHWRSERSASSNTIERPPNSAASPALVPVPWASISSTVSGP